MRLYNTLTRSVDELALREPGRFGMYVCGPTVQDVPHFGHARAEIVPDVLRRYLEWSGVNVLHVRNITDVDDKIIAKADAQGRTAAEVAEEYGRIYGAQMARLGVLPPHLSPRATGHIIEMLDLIERLIANGSAYESGGDVFFAVRTFEGYGKLSGRNVDELMTGARVETDERKRDPLDFALWKAGKPGEPSWPSPWGAGRPGWHIECSAMAGRYLGEGFDLHGGGTDLVFPHHENEVAQSEAATKQPFARHWLHHGMLNVGGEKMSKSVGNFVTLADALDRYGADVVRFFFLAAHYRSPLDLSDERLIEAAAAVERWRAFARAAQASVPAGGGSAGHEFAASARASFAAALEDDLSTPRAHAALFDLTSAGNQQLAAGDRAAAAATRDVLVELTGVLGYTLAEPMDQGSETLTALVEAMLELRAEVRSRKDFTTADGIRERLSAAGVVVEDSADGARWHLEQRPLDA